MFVEMGPAAPMSAIAKRLGVSQPALSQRFGSKRQLLLRAFVPRNLPAWLARLEAGPDDRPIEAQLREGAVQAMAVLAEAVPAMITLRLAGLELLGGAGGAPLPHVHVRKLVTAFFARCSKRGLLRTSAAAGDVATVFIGALQAQVLSDYVEGHQPSARSVRRHAHAVVDLVLHGAAAEGD